MNPSGSTENRSRTTVRITDGRVGTTLVQSGFLQRAIDGCQVCVHVWREVAYFLASLLNCVSDG